MIWIRCLAKLANVAKRCGRNDGELSKVVSRYSYASRQLPTKC